MEISESELHQQIHAYTDAIDSHADLSPEEYIKIGLLWNTIGHYIQLMEEAPVMHFYEIVRDKLMPKMVEVLEMEVSRGYSFYSKRFDFALGGIMQERYRYQLIKEQ